MNWHILSGQFVLDRPLVMAILNITPDSFSDGGEFLAVDDALRRAETAISEGADILDIGGESTRPGSCRVEVNEELGRVIPVIEAIVKRFDTPISIDTSKSEVAKLAIEAGAEIINDISGLRWDPEIAAIAATQKAGLILMHSRGEFETMHSIPPAADILTEVKVDLWRAIDLAKMHGVKLEQIAIDIGVGFGKTHHQNLELLAKVGRLVDEFTPMPVTVGTSRKSFIDKILGGTLPKERIAGSLATVLIAAQNGAKILRVHDVKETVAVLRVVQAVSLWGK